MGWFKRVVFCPVSTSTKAWYFGQVASRLAPPGIAGQRPDLPHGEGASHPPRGPDAALYPVSQHPTKKRTALAMRSLVPFRLAWLKASDPKPESLGFP